MLFKREVKFTLVREKKNYSIENIYSDVKGQVWYTLRSDKKQTPIPYDKNLDKIFVGGREIIPEKSFAVNNWNAMLPFISHKVDEKIIDDFLSKLGLNVEDE